MGAQFLGCLNLKPRHIILLKARNCRHHMLLHNLRIKRCLFLRRCCLGGSFLGKHCG